jgi:Tol biopolymer transport system component
MKVSTRFAVYAALALVGVAAGAVPAMAADPGLNGRISFASPVAGSLQVFTMNPDGSAVKQLTSSATGANSINSDWSPDGEQIAFDSDRTGAIDVFTMRSDGSDVHQVTHMGGFSVGPSWSPDGRRLVFAHFPAPGVCCTNLWRVNAAGTGLHQLTHFTVETFAGEPEFSPDGRWIAFQEFPNDLHPPFLSAIFVMRANGTEMRQVTPLQLDAGHPEWSPDGSRIIFNNDFTQPAAGDIFTIRPSGTGLTQLTSVSSLGEADFRPDYSPDGTKIVFNQFIPVQPTKVLVMNADGSGAHVINSNGFAPDWGSRPESSDE